MVPGEAARLRAKAGGLPQSEAEEGYTEQKERVMSRHVATRTTPNEKAPPRTIRQLGEALAARVVAEPSGRKSYAVSSREFRQDRA
jgi:hypothetical protein